MCRVCGQLKKGTGLKYHFQAGKCTQANKTLHKTKFSIKDFFSKFDQNRNGIAFFCAINVRSDDNDDDNDNFFMRYG